MKVKRNLILFGALVLTSLITQANAADGCKFLLCLGAVNPMGIPECASTVKEVLHDLKKGRPFPTCKMSNGLDSKSSGSFVTHRRASYTPPCPTGTTQGKDGVIYHVGSMPTNIRRTYQGYKNLPTGSMNERLSEDSFVFYRAGDYSKRVCVGGKNLGSLPAISYKTGGDRVTTPPHQWYERVQVMKPDGASYDFDLFIDNKLYSNHRF